MAEAAAHPRYDYIDCVRGYAVLLVMVSHWTYMFPQLPYPLHRITATGWFGVQLFFIASCLTLLMSWNHETATRGRASIGAFFTRRFFRIVPAFYVAALIYFVFEPPGGGFDLTQALATLGFFNAWHPYLTPTVPGRWTVVPGSWSISVEVTFYLLFPLIAFYVRSLRRAVILLVLSILVGVIANWVALATFLRDYSATANSNFLFFWLPNQISVFACGACLYHAMRWLEQHQVELPRPSLWALAAIALFVAPSVLPIRAGQYLGGTPLVPLFLAICLPLALFVLALSRTKGMPFINRPVKLMGQVSFSAYLLHFLVLDAFHHLPQPYLGGGTEAGVVVAFVLWWPAFVAATFAVAWLQYRFIELPGIQLGRNLIRRRRTKAAVSA